MTVLPGVRIFAVMGTPSSDAAAQLTHPTMRRCLLALAATAPKPGADLAARYAAIISPSTEDVEGGGQAGGEGNELDRAGELEASMGLLRSMLAFAPAERPVSPTLSCSFLLATQKCTGL